MDLMLVSRREATDFQGNPLAVSMLCNCFLRNAFQECSMVIFTR